MHEIEGVFNLLKPPGLSSNDLVTDVKRLFSAKSVGHLGTLDPGAAGVLPVTMGRATKLFDYLVDKEKEYIAEISFGQETDTQDALGAVIASAPCHITTEQVKNILPQFRGSIEQTAPMYSALKHQGQKLYDLALKGEHIEKIRAVSISELEYLEETGENRHLIRATTSRGTYIRTLCRDIGAAFNVPAHMSFLLRTRSGPFTLSGAITFPELQTAFSNGTHIQHLHSCEETLSFLPRIDLPADRLIPTKNGLSTHIATPSLHSGLCLLHSSNTFLGIGEIKGTTVKLKVHLYATNA
ncbi:MAG: tRNA pseudouridine(55) synthase TruB [Clostridiales bacterium]|nr:tRNA pseudouridine(55) synthase TruB [Clostridiales bacterium]